MVHIADMTRYLLGCLHGQCIKRIDTLLPAAEHIKIS
jgi:hypothetical protein